MVEKRKEKTPVCTGEYAQHCHSCRGGGGGGGGGAGGGGRGGARDTNPVIQTQSNMLKELPDAVFFSFFLNSALFVIRLSFQHVGEAHMLTIMPVFALGLSLELNNYKQ